ncbi:MAG TPA: NnrS family protein [Devosia sp.]|jgi:uncharacterized protein involved in response to NO|nr:NnrS family protein [Devosia sp.]
MTKTLSTSRPATARKPVPRGIARSGPAILSYGFRPFFLFAGIVAVLDMVLWVGALSGWWEVGGPAGAIAWHGHEMLFGYATAALGGFVLTAVPNWTGRLPVSGPPLLGLIGLWAAGRILLMLPVTAGSPVSAVVDCLYLPALAFVVTREVVVGRNWPNVRVAFGLSALALLNIAFHMASFAGWDETPVLRGAVALFIALVCQVGGRIIPSFTRNYLARRGAERLPRPLGRIDHAALAAATLAGVAWTILPEGWPTALLCIGAAIVNAARLAGWRGQQTWREPLLLVLHVAYAFIPLGFVCVAAAAIELVSPASALHVLTVGVIGLTTLAVMTRASRGHTGRPLIASWITTTAYGCLAVVALLRPLAEMLPDAYHPILAASAIGWIVAFSLFVGEHAPMLIRPSRGR